MKETKNRYFFNLIMAVSFAAVLIIASLASLIRKDTIFSDNENRNLAQRPSWSLEAYLDGSFMKDYNTYANDQFIARDSWVKLKTNTELALGKKELNHVYKGTDGSLFEPFEPLPAKSRSQTVQAMNTFAAAYPDVKFQMMLIPNAAAIQPEKLPSHLSDPDQLKMMKKTSKELKGYTWMDAVTPLQKQKDKYIYYRSDHHWTSTAAYYVFEAFAKQNKLDTTNHNVESYLISRDFYGTLASRSSYYSGDPDEIYMYVSTNNEDKSTIAYVEEQKKSASFYEQEKLKTKDQYAVFFGGNHPLMEINTTSTVDKTLLIFKDSYANCFIPFLTPYYSRIVVVDPRYYAGDIHQLMKDQGVQEVLFLYNANTFYQDTSLDVLLGSK